MGGSLSDLEKKWKYVLSAWYWIINMALKYVSQFAHRVPFLRVVHTTKKANVKTKWGLSGGFRNSAMVGSTKHEL